MKLTSELMHNNTPSRAASELPCRVSGRRKHLLGLVAVVGLLFSGCAVDVSPGYGPYYGDYGPYYGGDYFFGGIRRGGHYGGHHFAGNSFGGRGSFGARGGGGAHGGGGHGGGHGR
jgi:hypothetical protein